MTRLAVPGAGGDVLHGRDRVERHWARQRRRYKVTLRATPSFTVDVSAGGFCAETSRVLPPGTPVEGTLSLRGSELPFTGLVAWAWSGSPHLGLRGRMGVRFTWLTSELRDQLQAASAGRT